MELQGEIRERFISACVADPRKENGREESGTHAKRGESHALRARVLYTLSVAIIRDYGS